jgi:fructose-1,6-bisphosphatase/inositol monophosphatase family enzyme
MAAGMLLVSEAGGKVDGLVDGIDLCKPKQHVVAANSIVFGNFKRLIEN